MNKCNAHIFCTQITVEQLHRNGKEKSSFITSCLRLFLCAIVELSRVLTSKLSMATAVVLKQSNSDYDFGHFEEMEETPQTHTATRTHARNVWLSQLTIPENRPRSEVHRILNQIRIVNPSESVRVASCSNLNMNNPHTPSKSKQPTRCSMNISSCVNGLRLVQLKTGFIRAEFQLIVCCGSMSYTSWKYMDEFEELAKMVRYIHSRSSVSHSNYEHSLKEWETVERNLRRGYWFWDNSLDITYLVEQSVRLGNFVQELLLESTNPRLLLLFIKNQDFIVQ